MFPERIHRYIFLFGLCGLAFGMMIGTVPTSVPQLILMGNWLVEADFKRKWEQLKFNKLFWILSSVFLIHVVGLIYTQDLNAGLNDVRTKMPLMFLPVLLLSTKPISLKEFHIVLYCFIAGCIANTMWCLLYSFMLHKNELVRSASRFMSHIRLGLYLNIAIACCVYFLSISTSIRKRLLLILTSLYFVFTLYSLGLASGLINFIILSLLGLCYIIYKQKLLVKIVSFAVLFCLVIVIGNYFLEIKNLQLAVKQTSNNKITTSTLTGKPYIHFDTTGQKKENGNFIFINIQLEELQREWKRAFPADSFNYDKQHNLDRYEVLVRYLASKGLNKDSAGIAALTALDKDNIQKNIPNYEYLQWSYLRKRTYELVNEYDEFLTGKHVNGHSLTMRFYFWKAATHIIKDNFLIGVGTGDVQETLNKTYVETNSPLNKEWYKRPHNQFLTLTVALGIFGLSVFLFSIFYPVVILRKYLPKLYWPFFIIALISFLLEDTLETQAGLTFFAFFNTLFLVVGFYKRQKTMVDSL